MKKIQSKVVLILLTVLLLNNCAFRPYRFEIQQGNIIPQDKVAQIKTGMSQDQVRFILGTPLLQDVFHEERWDYIYYLKPQRGEVVQRHLAIYFDNGLVDHMTEDNMPQKA